jgi:riboflavin kinase/FMN adenylyltransferase
VSRPLELIRGLHNLRPEHRGCVATIGNYDGVHRGHQHMLEATRRKADELGVPVTVVTFEDPPRILRGRRRRAPDAAAREA